MAYGHIKLPDLNYLRQQIHPGDFLSLIDITSFYLVMLPLISQRVKFHFAAFCVGSDLRGLFLFSLDV